MTEKTSADSKKLAELCAKIADEMKGDEISVLDVGRLTTVADYFVVCAGNSPPHLNAISDNAVEKVREKLGKKPRISSGSPQSGWIALDYGSVIMHIFSKPARERYNLEALWNDAPKTNRKAKSRKAR